MVELTIGEVARRGGVRPSALRYYERAGLLPPARRVGGRRRYDAGTLQRLAAIRAAQGAGFTLAEIRAMRDDGGADTPPSSRWRALAGRKRAELDARIARAEAMKRALDAGLRCDCLTLDDCALVAAARAPA
jgi:MerR family redox-sensitive transcriptional activator SoxR